MKTSNILLTAAIIITVIVQVLLLSGYRDAYDKLRASPTKLANIPYDKLRATHAKLANIPVEKIHVLCVTNDISLIVNGDKILTSNLQETLVNLIVKDDTLYISRKDDINNNFENNYQVIVLPYLKTIITKAHGATVRAVYYNQSHLSFIADYTSHIELENNRLDSLSCKAIGSSTITLANNNDVKNLDLEVGYRATFESNNIAYERINKQISDNAQINLIGKSLKSFGVK